MALGNAISLGFSKGTGHIPTAGKALFWLDGTLSGSEFVDRSGNGRNFTITGKDFTANYFPYKSAATISAPAADATLIAADVNNFLYDSGGTPNEIPVVSFFQNIDYEDIGFCRHIAQVVDGNGVETTEPAVTDIVWYQAALTGSELASAVTYYSIPTEDAAARWVAPDGNDTTGNGTKALPWLTITKAVATENTGKLIYAKSKPDYPGHASLNYIYDQKNNLIAAIGRAITTGSSASNGFRIDNALVLSVKRIIVESPNAGTYQMLVSNSCINTVFEFMKINSISANYGIYGAFQEFKNSILNGSYTTGIWGQVATDYIVDTCIFAGVCGSIMIDIESAGNMQVKNTKFTGTAISSCIEIVANTSMVIKGNTFNTIATRHIRVYADIAAEILYNTFNLLTGTTSAIIQANGGTAFSLVKGNKFDNTINGLETNIVSMVNGAMQFENNIIDSGVNVLTAAADITGDVTISGTYGGMKVLNNRITSKRTADYHINIGKQGTSVGDEDFQNSEIQRNYILSVDPDGVGTAQTTHGMYIGFQSDGLIRYNYIIGSEYGAIAKGTTGITGPILSYNLLRECKRGLYIKGQQAGFILNNTVVNKNIGTTFGFHLGDNTGGDDADNCVVKNNIFIMMGTGDQYGGYVSAIGSNVIDYNLYYAPNGTLKFSIGAAPKTFAEWQAAGFDVNGKVLSDSEFAALFTDYANNDFSLAAGSAAIGAGTPVMQDEGLRSTTDWGDADTVPSVVTWFQPNTGFDCGAYIYAGRALDVELAAAYNTAAFWTALDAGWSVDEGVSLDCAGPSGQWATKTSFWEVGEGYRILAKNTLTSGEYSIYDGVGTSVAINTAGVTMHDWLNNAATNMYAYSRGGGGFIGKITALSIRKIL